MLQRITGHARGNAVAYLALFVALSGTAVAASVKLSANSVGTAQLRNRAVTGRKVAKGTLTGANIKASTLGTVPSATNATNAISATNATTATNATNAANATNATNAVNATNAESATNAANATNAAKLGGQAPDSFQARVGGTCSSGSAVASIAAAGTVGCQSTNVTQMMGGIPSLIPNGTHYLAAEGLTTSAPTTQTDGVGAPAVAGTAGNLDVGVFSLQPIPLTFTLDVNDSPTALTCTVPAGGGTCSDSSHSVSIPAGALVDLSQSGGSGVVTQIGFGWTDTTSG